MIVKRTFISSGNQKQDVAAELNAQIRDCLVETGVLRLVCAEIGDAGRPKYTLEYKDSGYQIILQSAGRDYVNHTQVGIQRGALDTAVKWNSVDYGKAAEAIITMHLITSGDSFAFKFFDAANKVSCGGSCIRYTTLKGEQAYLFHSNEGAPRLGYMGRYEIEPGKIGQVAYLDYPHSQYAVIQEHPIITFNDVVLGYANDLVTLHLNGLSESHTFSVYRFHGKEYYGGKIVHGPYSSSVSACTAAAFKEDNSL